MDPARPPHLFYVLLMVLNGLTNCKCFVISNKSGLRVCYMPALFWLFGHQSHYLSYE